MFLTQDPVGTELSRCVAAGPANRPLLHCVRDVHVPPPVLVLAKVLLQARYQLAQGFPFLGHHIGQHQTIENAITLWQISGVADSSRFLPANHDFLFHHQIGNIFEADGALDQLPAVSYTDAVNHLGCVKRADYRAGPVASFQQPAQQNADDLVRVNKSAMLVHCADAVSISIRNQASVAFFPHDSFLQQSDMWKNGLGIDAREKRVHILTNGGEGNSRFRKDPRQNPPPGTMHGINSKFESSARDIRGSSKCANRCDVWVGGISLSYGGAGSMRSRPRAKVLLNDLH